MKPNRAAVPSSFAAWLLLLALLLSGAAQAVVLNIPSTYPRNWYGNAARLAQARAHHQATPFTPSGDGSVLNFGRALRGLLANNTADCDQAVAFLDAWRAPAGIGGFRDATRQQGENLLVRTPDLDAQSKSADVLRAALNDNYEVSLNLASNVPDWLTAIGAHHRRGEGAAQSAAVSAP